MPQAMLPEGIRLDSPEGRTSTSGRETIPAPSGALQRQPSGGGFPGIRGGFRGASPPHSPLPMHPGEALLALVQSAGARAFSAAGSQCVAGRVPSACLRAFA